MTRKKALGAAAIGLCVAAAACEGTISSPAKTSALAAGPSPAAEGPVGSDEPVVRVADSVQVGSSRLVRTPIGINFTLSTTDLTAGHAYTLWFVAFNRPENCAVPFQCAPDDVVNDAAQPDMMYGAGSIAGGEGKATFAGRRSVGDNSGSLNMPVGLPSYGLLDPVGAEVLMAIHDHGPKLPEYLPDMFQTIDGGCTDAGIPAAGVPSPWNDHTFGRRGPNTCATIQVTVHRP